MPKELTHWQVAHEALAGGIPESLKKMLYQHLPLYFLGAVAHDIPFYDLAEPAETSLVRVGNLLHGVNGENTMVPLLDILSAALVQEDSEALVTFLLGMLTHFCADSTFHPAVYYFSGNYFDPDPVQRGKAVFRHRLLETGLDFWLQGLKPLNYPKTLFGLWRDTGEQGRRALDLLVSHYRVLGVADTALKARFQSAWLRHRIYQAAFRWPAPWQILRIYHRLTYPEAPNIIAMFHSRPYDSTFFRSTPDWQHPVTGESFHAGFGALFVESIKRALAIFRRLGIQEPQTWPEVLREFPPLSLDSGLAYVSVQEMRYFS